jgi:hypothetical protein
VCGGKHKEKGDLEDLDRDGKIKRYRRNRVRYGLDLSGYNRGEWWVLCTW